MMTPRLPSQDVACSIRRGSASPWDALRVQDTDGPRSKALEVLADRVRQRFGDSTVAVLFYGSVLRDRLDVEDGMFDLLVIVDSYRRAYGSWRLSILNAVLPPNVFYLEASLGDKRIRAKYATISLAQLRRHIGPRCLQSYFWGRLAQPVVVAYTADEEAEREVDTVLSRSNITFASCTAPLFPSSFDARALWSRGLESCYRTEFRPETRERAQVFTEQGLSRYRSLCPAIAAELGWGIEQAHGSEAWFSVPTSRLRRWRAHATWSLRRIQGRVLQVLRLAKASWTFAGGIDYLLWKIERHSGVRVEVSDRTRRHPLIFGWWTLWRLRRKGGFR